MNKCGCFVFFTGRCSASGFGGIGCGCRGRWRGRT